MSVQSVWHRRLSVIAVRALLAAALIGITYHAFAPLEHMFIDTGWDVTNHIIAFFVLACGLDFAFPKHSLGIAAISGLLAYGMAIEFIQSFIPNRFASIPDILADIAGIALYLAVVPVLRRLPPFAGRWRSTVPVSSNRGISEDATTTDSEKV